MNYQAADALPWTALRGLIYGNIPVCDMKCSDYQTSSTPWGLQGSGGALHLYQDRLLIRPGGISLSTHSSTNAEHEHCRGKDAFACIAGLCTRHDEAVSVLRLEVRPAPLRFGTRRKTTLVRLSPGTAVPDRPHCVKIPSPQAGNASGQSMGTASTAVSLCKIPRCI